MDRLELRVGDGSLHEGGKRIAVGEAAKIIEELHDVLRWRWHERCGAWVVVASAEPVLLGPHGATAVLEPRSREESTVDREDVTRVDRLRCVNLVDGPRHGLDVVKNLHRGGVGWLDGKALSQLSAQQPASSHLEALDLR